MIRNISPSDLEFDRIPVTVYTSKGLPFNKWIDTGMPRIPNGMLNSVFFLYKSEEDAKKGVKTGGSGFVIEKCYEIKHAYTTHVMRHFYAVTNYHVAIRDSFNFIRINTHDGGVDVIEIGLEDWQHDPNGDDVAIAEIDLHWFNHNVAPIPIELIASKDDLINVHNIGIGDDVFMLGKFVDMDTSDRNQPTARFGCISSMPYPVENYKKQLKENYFLDMRSRSGYSGSPVFVYRTPGSNLDYILNNFDPKNPIHYDVSTKLLLLGIHRGQFSERMRIEGTENNILGLSGMTLVVPSWRVLELLNCEEFSKNRDKKDIEQIEKYGVYGGSGFVDESENETPSTHKEDFNNLLDAAVRGKQ